jgi:integrase
MTFNTLFLEYIEIISPLHSNKELINKKSRYENHIKSFISNLELQDIKYKDCQKIVNEAIYTKELSPKTAKNINAIVQTVLNYAIRNEYTEKNPAEKVIIPKYDNKYNIDLTKEQIQSLFDAVFSFPNPTHRDIFILAVHGRRKSEILSMQWSQIDFILNQYHIPPSKNKARKHDIHEITPILRNALFSRFEEAKKQDSFTLNDYIFLSSQTNTMYVDFRKPFYKLKALAGIGPSFRFHDFRHLLATYTINQKGSNIEHVSYALGHSSIEVTQKYITKDSNISAVIVNQLLEDFVKDLKK